MIARRAVPILAALTSLLVVTACGAPDTTTSGLAPPAARAPARVPCDAPDARTVSDVRQLRTALAAARPGTSIRLAPGTYPGPVVVTGGGTAQQPITVCGGPGAVLEGGSIDAGYTVHLRGASNMRLSGFTVRGGQKGVMADGARGVLIDGLTIEGVGDEALHLRAGSSDNVVTGTRIRGTGLREPEFGEGIYIGSAESNWCEYSACGPDRSDRNVVEFNDIAETTSESVDIKEGTTGGILRGNTFAGTRITGKPDSWVDVKGNDWAIVGNSGVDAPKDGFQTHEILEGWGERNLFDTNSAVVGTDGYAINVTKRDRGNRVTCNNQATDAGAGLSTVACG